MYPVWLKPLRNASRFLTVTCAELDPRNPITGIAGCCASAAAGQAAAPPSSNMNLRRFTAQCLPCFHRKIAHLDAPEDYCAAGFRSAHVAFGSKAERLAASIFRPDYPQERTSSMRCGTSDLCQ